MQKGNYQVEFSAHATFQAENRNLPPEVVQSVIQAGTFFRFAKDMVKIRKTCGNQIVTCVGQIKGDRIKIITITCNRKNP